MAPNNSKSVSIRSLPTSMDEVGVRPRRRGISKHALGLLLLLIVVILWQVQNFLGSSILSNNVFAKPFFLVYLNTLTLMFVGLPTLIRETSRKYHNGTLRSTVRKVFSWKGIRSVFVTRAELAASVHSERQAFLKSGFTYGTLPTTAPPGDVSLLLEKKVEVEYLPFLPTFRLALKFFLFWSSFSYLAQASLQFTTVASSTILGSTSSIWALILGALSHTEKFTWKKLCGVLTCLAGIILISSVDLTTASTDEPQDGYHFAPIHHTNRTTVPTYNGMSNSSSFSTTSISHPYTEKTSFEIAIGDTMSLLSALVYGFYTIVLKQGTLEAGSLSIHMPTFFGLVGLLNVVLLLPVFPILHYTGVEPFGFPQNTQLWVIVAMNSLASMISDVMCAYVVVFTSPLIVTVGLGLGIPLSLVGQMVLQAKYEHPLYWVGGMIVVASFVFVEREEVKDEQEVKEEFVRRSLEASLILGLAVNHDEEIDDEENLVSKGIMVKQGKNSKDSEGFAVIGDVVVAGPSTPPDTKRYDP